MNEICAYEPFGAEPLEEKDTELIIPIKGEHDVRWFVLALKDLLMRRSNNSQNILDLDIISSTSLSNEVVMEFRLDRLDYRMFYVIDPMYLLEFLQSKGAQGSDMITEMIEKVLSDLIPPSLPPTNGAPCIPGRPMPIIYIDPPPNSG